MSYRATIPKIVWNGHVWLLGGPLDGARAYGVPRRGSTRDMLDNGETDGWIRGREHFLDGVADYIPGADVESGPYAGVTGWDGDTGVEAFLATWAWAGETFDFYPDATLATAWSCVLELPHVGDFPSAEDDGTRSLALRLRSVARTPFTGY